MGDKYGSSASISHYNNVMRQPGQPMLSMPGTPGHPYYVAPQPIQTPTPAYVPPNSAIQFMFAPSNSTPWPHTYRR